MSVLAKNSGRVLYASQLPVVRARKEEKPQTNHPPQPSIMVIIKQGDYTPDKNAASISSNGNGSERQLPRRQLPRLLGQQLVLPSPGNSKVEAVTVSIDFSASFNFNGDGDSNNDNNDDGNNNGNIDVDDVDVDNGNGVGAGGKRKRGTGEEEMEEEAE